MVNRKRYSRTMSIVIAVAMVFSVMVFMPEDVSAAAKKPGKVTITRATKLNQMIKVTWKKTKGAKAYQVYAKAGKGKWKKVGTVKANGQSKQTYIIKKCKWNTRYQIKMRAVNGKKKGGWSRTYQGKLAKKTTLQKFVASKAPWLTGDVERAYGNMPGASTKVYITGNIFVIDMTLVDTDYTGNVPYGQSRAASEFLNDAYINQMRADAAELETIVGIFGLHYRVRLSDRAGNLLLDYTY